MGRLQLLLRILCSNIDPIVRLGLLVGLMLGISLSTTGFLLSGNVMDSFMTFIQRSMIGVRGAVQVRFSGAPDLMNQFLQTMPRDSFPYSRSWDSGQALALEVRMSQQVWKGQARIQFTDQAYLAKKMRNCPTDDTPQLLMNPLFKLSFPQTPLPIDGALTVPSLNITEQPVSFSRCSAETGMMTDKPMLFIPWESLPDLKSVATETVEFYTANKEEESEIVRLVDEILKDLPRQRGEQYQLIRLFEDPKMVVAEFIGVQTQRLSWSIAGISTTLASLILVFGLLMLLDFKSDSIRVYQLCGGTRLDLLGAIALLCLLLGMLASGIGIFLTGLIRVLLGWTEWIPYENFLQAIPSPVLLSTFLGLPVIVTFVGVCATLAHLYFRGDETV